MVTGGRQFLRNVWKSLGKRQGKWKTFVKMVREGKIRFTVKPKKEKKVKAA
jgi:hypothetical protein